MSADNDRASRWEGKWTRREIGFHNDQVHGLLVKHFDKLKGDGKLEKVFVPLCGKSNDMKWLVNQGSSAIGVDIVPSALREFFTDNNLEYTEVSAPSMGPDCQLFQSKDGKVKLYSGDVFLYNDSLDGKFDAIWDRGSLVALNRPDVPSYAKLLKKLLNPGGRILLETMEYDLAIMKEMGGKHPPPHPMFEDEIRRLYEPDCSVVLMEKEDRTLAMMSINTAVYLITKK